MHAALLVGLGAAVVVAVLVVAFMGRHRKPASCVKCGAPSAFGYSIQAESSLKDTTRVCLNCLKTKLAKDYEQFSAHALVIEPAATLPCYVFQPNSKWKDSKLADEAQALLATMEGSCHRCGARANFLWLTSKGLRDNTAEKVFANGVSETLLRWGNSAPDPVCGKCCVNLISASIESQHLTFIEVCGPRSEDGFVVPMGY